MYRLNRLNSANHRSALSAAYPKRLLRTNIGHSSPAAAAGIGQISDTGKTYTRKRGDKLTQLSRSVVMLTCESSAAGGICNVYLVGVRHHLPKSIQEVKAAVQFLKPEVVFLELCSSRTNLLTGEKVKVPTMREMVDMWKKNQKPSWILYKWYEAKRISQLKVTGGEMQAANVEAMKYGAKVILGDRSNEITQQRYIAKTSLWQWHTIKFKGLPSTSPNNVTEKLGRKFDAHAWDQYVQDLAKNDPAGAETFIHERDLYMSAKLLEVARKHGSVVAVVGKGHLLGIQKNWKQPVDVEQLLSIPNDKMTIIEKILSSIGVTSIVYGIYLFIKY